MKLVTIAALRRERPHQYERITHDVEILEAPSDNHQGTPDFNGRVLHELMLVIV